MTSAHLIKPHLIADIGGTNARFALSLDQAPFFERLNTVLVSEFESIDQAIDDYLKQQGVKQLESIDDSHSRRSHS